MARTLINAQHGQAWRHHRNPRHHWPPDGNRLQAGHWQQPRNIIQRFPASTTAWGSSMPAVFRHGGQPYLAFFVRAQDGGTLVMRWDGDKVRGETVTLTVTG
jgi:hypothetical protein